MAPSRPLAVDLFCGLSGWGEGLIAAGWDVIGFDLENMFAAIGEPMPPEHFQLVIQDVLTIHGAQFKNVGLIVSSSPCQDFSYRSMPWSRAKAMHAPFLGMWLFWAQFRIQREASEAAGRHIPLVAENVRGAIPWVGRSRGNYGSYHLWGDVPAVLPLAAPRKRNPDGSNHGQGSWFAIADSKNRGTKNNGGSWFNIGGPGQAVTGQDPDGRKVPGFRFDGSGRSFQTAAVAEGLKHGGDWFSDPTSPSRQSSSKSPARKAASAKIAKIPFALAQYIGEIYYPTPAERALT